jgi:hypothetical protein
MLALPFATATITAPAAELIAFFTRMLIALTAVPACLEAWQHKYARFCTTDQPQDGTEPRNHTAY